MLSNSFKDSVESLVTSIPLGRVMTYGQIAALCGSARAARIVGGIAHYGNPSLPWHRVVNRNGGLASGFPGGRLIQKDILASEGVKIDKNLNINLQEYIYRPSKHE
jgi:methylated-DNA-protein-cysteine methyltransferase-like protein